MALEERVSKLEGTTEQILERLNSIDARMTSLETRMDERFRSLETRMDERFNSFESRMDARFNTQMTVFVGMWITTMAFTLATLVTVLLRT